jgi:hypothetical protein
MLVNLKTLCQLIKSSATLTNIKFDVIVFFYVLWNPQLELA